MDGVPKEIDLEKDKSRTNESRWCGTDIHHMHVWALSTTENALTAHLVV
jgi:cobalt-zinc-cadmium efflux system protein